MMGRHGTGAWGQSTNKMQTLVVPKATVVKNAVKGIKNYLSLTYKTADRIGCVIEPYQE